MPRSSRSSCNTTPMSLPFSLVSEWKNQCFYLKNESEDSLYKFACLAAAWGVKRERELWMDAVNKRKTKY